MPRQTPDPQTIFHLVPDEESVKACEILHHPDNKPFVSRCKGRSINSLEIDYGLEIGYHVPKRTLPQVITEVGRDADLILSGATISKIHFSFEIHPESRQIMFCDRSRLRNIRIEPFGFRKDGDFRQVVLQPGVEYRISFGGEQLSQYVFNLVWSRQSADVLDEARKGYENADARAQNPRWARTVEEGPTELPSWYNTRLHTPSAGAVLRTTVAGDLGEGSFGVVKKAVDLDSGCLIAAKIITLSNKLNSSELSEEESLLRREVKTLSSISHKNIVEYLGASGWNTGFLHIYMSLKEGNVCDLLKKEPLIRSDNEVLTQLLQAMLEALDYLAFRGWCHRDVKPANILYTKCGENRYIFQLADFGLANKQLHAKTLCGSPLYIAPEVMFGTHAQTPKMDIWSLFVAIGVVTQAGGLHKPRFAHYRDVLSGVRAAAAIHKNLSQMAEEDPQKRPSAAQMLVKYFEGQGLSTPRHQIGPILDAVSMSGPEVTSNHHESGIKLKYSKLKDRRRGAIDKSRSRDSTLKRLSDRNVHRQYSRPRELAEFNRLRKFTGLRRHN